MRSKNTKIFLANRIDFKCSFQLILLDSLMFKNTIRFLQNNKYTKGVWGVLPSKKKTSIKKKRSKNRKRNSLIFGL